jgi:hypothetical protein
LDVSLVEEVNSNSQENYCCGGAIQPHIWDMDTKLLSFGKLDIGYFMENSSALCPGSATLDRFRMERRIDLNRF